MEEVRVPKKGVEEITDKVGIGGLRVFVRDDGAILLVQTTPKYVRGHYTPEGKELYSIHYYVTNVAQDKTIDDIRRLVEWLGYGFWWQSWTKTEEPVIQRFKKKLCIGETHFL